MNDRHAKVSVKCEWCGVEFLARKERVDKGQGRYCGKKCFDEWQRKQKKDTIWGRKDLATTYLVGGRYCARWYDENGKTKSTPYPRWWWEMNVGEIPKGLLVLHIDNNPLNIDPSNFKLGTKSEVLRIGNTTRKANTTKWEIYVEKLRVLATGRKHTEESKRKISISHLGKPTPSGSNHYMWRGGISKEYPKEFFEIRQFVINRDYSSCQICSRNLTKNQHVHHRDGNKENNDQNNLLTLCASCHRKVHSTKQESPPIMSLRSELSWAI